MNTTTQTIRPTYNPINPSTADLISSILGANRESFESYSEAEASASEYEEITFFSSYEENVFRPTVLENTTHTVWVENTSDVCEYADVYYEMASGPSGKRFFAPDLLGKNFLVNGVLHTVSFNEDYGSFVVERVNAFHRAKNFVSFAEELPRGNFWA